jgi:hypothetical protein
MDREQRLFFRDAFRDARAAALRDAEGFQQILFALERFGSFLTHKQQSLGRYKRRIVEFVVESSGLDGSGVDDQPGTRTAFETLYDLVQDGRNSALHEGAFARQLTSHCLDLAVRIEEALSAGMATIGDFAVHHPICASEWHPLSFVRHTMLANSFSYLPVRIETDARSGWRLISDLDVARFLREPGETARKDRMRRTVGDLCGSDVLRLQEPYSCAADTHVHDALAHCRGLPILVVTPGAGDLVGIATPFDLM